MMRIRGGLLVAMVVALAGCADHSAAIVGSAFTAGTGPHTFNVFVSHAFDSSARTARLTLVPWSSLNPLLLRREAEQAAVFAQTKGLVAVVGHGGSRGALVAAEVYNRARVPHIIPTATSRRLADSGPWTFRMVPNDDAEGQFIANYAIDTLGVRRIAVFYVGDEYGVGIRDGVASRLASRGYEVVDQTAVPQGWCSGAADAHEGVRLMVRAALKRSSPDAVVMAIGGVYANCWIQLLRDESPNLWILGADGFELSDSYRLPAAYKSRVMGVSFWQPGTDSLNQAFVERARQALGRNPGAGDALSYDAFALISAAVHEVGPNRRAVRAWLASLGRTRAAWMGVTGPVSFVEERRDILRMVRIN